MKIYLLVEGISTEMHVYPYWLKHFLPSLEHYNDFGHSLIYVYKSKQISDTLKDFEVDKCLALCLVRSLIYATREDLIPEFSEYRTQLERFDKIQPPTESADINLRNLYGRRFS